VLIRDFRIRRLRFQHCRVSPNELLSARADAQARMGLAKWCPRGMLKLAIAW
jgi:hypothetical protein